MTCPSAAAARAVPGLATPVRTRPHGRRPLGLDRWPAGRAAWRPSTAPRYPAQPRMPTCWSTSGLPRVASKPSAHSSPIMAWNSKGSALKASGIASAVPPTPDQGTSASTCWPRTGFPNAPAPSLCRRRGPCRFRPAARCSPPAKPSRSRSPAWPASRKAAGYAGPGCWQRWSARRRPPPSPGGPIQSATCRTRRCCLSMLDVADPALAGLSRSQRAHLRRLEPLRDREHPRLEASRSRANPYRPGGPAAAVEPARTRLIPALTSYQPRNRGRSAMLQIVRELSACLGEPTTAAQLSFVGLNRRDSSYKLSDIAWTSVWTKPPTSGSVGSRMPQAAVQIQPPLRSRKTRFAHKRPGLRHFSYGARRVRLRNQIRHL